MQWSRICKIILLKYFLKFEKGPFFKDILNFINTIDHLLIAFYMVDNEINSMESFFLKLPKDKLS